MNIRSGIIADEHIARKIPDSERIKTRIGKRNAGSIFADAPEIRSAQEIIRIALARKIEEV